MNVLIGMGNGNGLMEKIQRWKLLADLFIKENARAFVKDIYDNWYPCYILFSGEDSVHVQHFEGKKKGEKDRIYWANVVKFDKHNSENIEGKEIENE